MQAKAKTSDFIPHLAPSQFAASSFRKMAAAGAGAGAGSGAGVTSAGPFLRRRAVPSETVPTPLKSIGLKFFTSVVHAASAASPDQFLGPLTGVVGRLSKLPPLFLFPDWSPPREAVLEQLYIKTPVASTEAKGFEAANAAQGTATYGFALMVFFFFLVLSRWSVWLAARKVPSALFGVVWGRSCVRFVCSYPIVQCT